ncbi:MAG: PQQ-binding-like beta-propeller repeat protein [Planctomycetes bacterium]|nr:PQQ-binding-like beta-propeller repeat protein [Planctomycetota bacterium]
MQRRWTCWLALVIGLAVAPAQEGQPAPVAQPVSPPAAPADRLQALLQELAALDAAAWQARITALQNKIVAEDQRAAALKAQAAALLEQAAQAEVAGKAVQAEIARLQELQKLLQAGPPTRLEPMPATPPIAMPGGAPMAAPMPAAAPEVAIAQPAAAPKTGTAAAPAELVTWAQIEPLFAERCSACHEPSEAKGGLDITTFAATRKGGGSGRTLVPGEPDSSRLFLMITQQERPFMPKGEDQLSKEQIARVRTWIEQGASETEAQARAFVARRQAAAKATATATAGATTAGPLPNGWPAVPLRTPARPPAVRSLVRSPNAALLAMPGIGQVLLFDGELRPLAVLPIEASRVDALTFSEDGTLLAAAVGEPGRHGQVAVFEVASGRRVASCGNERDVPLAIAVHAGSGRVALGGAGKRVRMFALADGQEQWAATHDDFVLALAFTHDGVLLAAGDRTGAVHLWETDGGQIAESLPGSRPAIAAMVMTAGNLLIVGDAGGAVAGHEALSGRQVWRQQAHDGEVTGLALAPDGTIASVGSDGRIRRLAADGKLQARSVPVGDWLLATAFGVDAGTVFAGDAAGRVFAFGKDERQELRRVVPLAPAQ